jgi:N-acetylglucosaminyldiphosphoundecaprenol N-acetyl-beta-D-mannosaminyltransferase
MIRKIEKILDINIDNVSMEEAVNNLFEFINEDRNHIIYTPNAEFVYNGTKDEKLKEALNNSDMNIPDGAGVVLAAKILNKPISEKVAGVDFTRNVLSDKRANSLSVFLLGSAPGVAKEAAKIIEGFGGRVNIAGVHDGFFAESDDDKIIAIINNSGANLLLVALGAPKNQEKWIFKHRDKLKCRVAIGVGGTLDTFAGRVKRAPEFFQKHGIEWLYRLYKQPKRFIRMLALPKFIIKVLKIKVFG